MKEAFPGAVHSRGTSFSMCWSVLEAQFCQDLQRILIALFRGFLEPGDGLVHILGDALAVVVQNSQAV